MAIMANSDPAQADANTFSTAEAILPVADNAYFIGLYDDTGANSISSVTLFESTGNGIGYSFDDVVSSRVVAIPEPTSLAALSLVAAGLAFRRQRRRRQSNAG